MRVAAACLLHLGVLGYAAIRCVLVDTIVVVVVVVVNIIVYTYIYL